MIDFGEARSWSPSFIVYVYVVKLFEILASCT